MAALALAGCSQPDPFLESARQITAVGDPDSVQIRNMRPSTLGKANPCGEVKFIARGNRGWTGWLPFISIAGGGVLYSPGDMHSSFCPRVVK